MSLLCYAGLKNLGRKEEWEVEREKERGVPETSQGEWGLVEKKDRRQKVRQLA